MTDTEISLLAVYRTPVVPLQKISEQYFGLTPKTAAARAKLNQLPVPTLRLADSQKAPYLVRLSDLAAHINATAAAAEASWSHSQI